ncbi:MAG: protein kinase [Gemmatimonadaceae bacterium]|nr:protein kinase [Gemmatimonadaceae bacterium]
MIEALRTALAGRYDLQRELGAGGMATVYLAQDVRHGREVAIKVMRPEIAQSVGAERFLREIQLAARLSHPHILPLFDSGDADGMLYYVMPRVRGRSLRDRLDEVAVLPVPEAVRVATEVAEALHHAHAHGVIHRDIKPENILLQDGHALVADFGIGRAVGELGGETLTQAGASLGTPTYMSPEQAVGDPVDGRSDLYALGCVLYEMLVGEPPFTGPTVQAVIAKRFVQTPADVAGLREGIPKPVARAVQRALARTSVDRFETGAAFAEALRAPDEAVAQAEERSIAVLPFANLSTDPDNEFFADGITEEILGALAQNRELRVAGRSSSFALKGKGFSAEEAATRLKVRTVLEGSVRRAGTRVRIAVQLTDASRGYQMWSERYDRDAADVFAVQDEIARAIAGKLDVTLARPAEAIAQRGSTDLEAYDAYLKGRVLLARRGGAVHEAIRCFEYALARDPDFGLAWAALANAYVVQGYWGNVDPAAVSGRVREAVNNAVRLAPGAAEAHAIEAMASLMFEWKIDAAEQAFQQAMALDRNYLQSGMWYWQFLRAHMYGEWDRAVAAMIAIVERDPQSAIIAGAVAVLLGTARQGDEALRWVERAAALDANAFLTHFGRQVAHLARRDYDAAIHASQAALLVSGRQSNALCMLGLARAGSGDHEGARDILNEMFARERREFMPCTNMAALAAAIGDPEQAMRLVETALARKEPTLLANMLGWPGFEPLQRIPAFDEIVRRVGLPGYGRYPVNPLDRPT